MSYRTRYAVAFDGTQERELGIIFEQAGDEAGFEVRVFNDPDDAAMAVIDSYYPDLGLPVGVVMTSADRYLLGVLKEIYPKPKAVVGVEPDSPSFVELGQTDLYVPAASSEILVPRLAGWLSVVAASS